jgi:hypothetical protein
LRNVTLTAPPEIGQLVRVRGQQWVVSDLSAPVRPRDELGLDFTILDAAALKVMGGNDSREFAERLPAESVEVEGVETERHGHALLARYPALRTGSPRRNDVMVCQ